jgi:uncharacterized phiE125 gp8 family phage protein
VGLVLLEAPAAPVVTVEEAQVQTRSSNEEERAKLAGDVAAATQMAEAFCRRKFVTQRWRQNFDRFPASFGVRGGVPGLAHSWFPPFYAGRITTDRRRDEVALVLSHPRLLSVESVQYVGPDGDLRTMPTTDYLVRAAEEPGEIVLAYAKSWPVARDVPDAVTVDFTCGYGDPDAVPAPIKSAILLLVGTLYANRESVAPVEMRTIPHNVEWLLGPYRVVRFAA